MDISVQPYTVGFEGNLRRPRHPFVVCLSIPGGEQILNEANFEMSLKSRRSSEPR